MANKDERLYELDGLRGWAALSVFMSHAVGLVPDCAIKKSLESSPLHFFWDGAAAVFLFFALSGFVLALPFVSGLRKLDLPSFLLRRFFRLYPAFWFAVGAGLLVRHLYVPADMVGLSRWANSFWHAPVPVLEILRHFTMVFIHDSNAINPPVWSLGVEMRASIVLPLFILLLANRRTVVMQAAALIAAFLVVIFTQAVNYLPVFVLGVLTAVNYENWKRPFATAPRSTRAILWLVALVLYGPWYFLPIEIPQPVKPYPIAFATILVIFLATTGSKSRSFLSNKVSTFLGETSYSFYLLHFPVLWLAASFFFPMTGSIIIPAAVAVTVTYLLSYLVYRYLEMPMHQAGRSLSNWIKPRLQREQAQHSA